MKVVNKVYIKGATLVKADSFDEGSLSELSVRTVFEEERFLLGALSATLRAVGYAGSAASANAGFGIVLGVDTVVDKWKAGFFGEVVKDGPVGASPLVFPYTSSNALAARATIAFNIKGDDITIASGPLSFLKAVSYGATLVGAGACKGLVVGGVARGVVFTIFLSAESGGHCLSDIFEQRAKGDALVRISTMEESFGLFADAMEESSSSRGEVNIKVSDPAGNMVGMTMALEPVGADCPV